MPINTEHYSDAIASKAHLGFLSFVFLDLLSKDETTAAQSFATFFIAIAIPMLILTLIYSPGENLEGVTRFQMWTAVISDLAGHGAGILALSLIFGSFNILAGIAFLLVALLAYIVMMILLFQEYGIESFMWLHDFLFGKKEQPVDSRETPLLSNADEEKEVATDTAV